MTLEETAELAQLLESRLVDWERARQNQEQKMLECYQDVMKISRDGDSKDSAIAKSRKAANIFIGSTRNKVRSSRAKINDALFGNGKQPFDTEPSEEALRDFSDVMEDIITEQLERMDFRSMMKAGVNTLCTYGTGFIFGPFVRKECLTETTADNSLGYTQIKEEKYEFDFPYFDLGNTLDCYPDPEARVLKDGLGIFLVTMESKHTIKAWKSDKSYSLIDEALQGGADRLNESGSEKAATMRANVEYWHKNDRVKVARFFGKVPESVLSNTDDESKETDIESEEMVDVIAIMAGGVIVKISRSPYNKTPSFRCVYEDVPHEIWGVGVAENNIPYQKITNAAFRLFVEGKGMALLGTKSVDRSMFMPTENFIKSPGKVYQFKPGLSPEERKSAIIDHIDTDVTNGWIDVIRMSEGFSDDDTGITKYTQGDDSQNLNKTAAGISMIMSASSLPLKEVIQNIDERWIEPVIEALIEWNIKYLELDTVMKIHGEKHAQAWQQIQQFGKTSFMNWQATGTSSFMQKEVLTSKLNAFSAFAMSNPFTASKIDVTELLEQTWGAMEIGKESPILKAEDGQPELPPEVQQHIDQSDMLIQQLQQELQQSQQEIAQREQQMALDAKDMQLQMEQLNAAKKELSLMEQLAIQKVDSASAQLDYDSQAREAKINEQAASKMETIAKTETAMLQNMLAKAEQKQIEAPEPAGPKEPTQPSVTNIIIEKGGGVRKTVLQAPSGGTYTAVTEDVGE